MKCFLQLILMSFKLKLLIEAFKSVQKNKHNLLLECGRMGSSEKLNYMVVCGPP